MNKLINALVESELLDFTASLPASMMALLKESAAENGVDLEIEVTMRLLATMLDPEAFLQATDEKDAFHFAAKVIELPENIVWH